MSRDEFETLLGSLAAQYTDACAEELAALERETNDQRVLDASEACETNAAYNSGLVSGTNKELRELQVKMALLNDPPHQERVSYANAAILARKAATMRRIGIENEIQLWRSWLASQGGNDG